MRVMSPCHVSVVLLCMGRGGDPNSFRPARDESQYWCRRDALVRCVTAFLFGPSGCSPTNCNSHSSSNNREMILIFDDDHAQVHLSLAAADSKMDIIPSEQVILALFKQAAQSPNQTVTCGSHGLICRTVMDPAVCLNNQQRTSNTKDPSSGLDSKRDVLEYLQDKCSIDFLRNHGLNSSASVILRKSNKKTLMEVWKKWQQQQDRGATTTSTKSTVSDPKITESLFHGVIQSFQDNGASKKEMAIVGTLHESCKEFPCFEPDDSGGIDQSFRVMFFLGAVRDMTVQENRVLDKVCHKLQVPRVGVRFSTVSEFTSKILSVLAFHQSHPKILKCALGRLLDVTSEDMRTSSSDIEEPSPRRPTCLHVIGQIPMPSSALSAELARRDRLHWCIVRVVVCTLWRSRLASSDNTAEHQNTLTLIFDDGVTLYLQEGAFVAKLASQHQAAPSEHQILSAIRSLLNSEQLPLRGDWSKKRLASSIVDKILSSSSQAVTSTISIDPLQLENSVSKSFFHGSAAEEHDEVSSCRSAILVLDVHKSRSDEHAEKISKMHRAVLTAVAKRNIPTISTSITNSGGSLVDYEASNIMCLQHFLYQNRLVVRQSTSSLGKKRKASG